MGCRLVSVLAQRGFTFGFDHSEPFPTKRVVCGWPGIGVGRGFCCHPGGFDNHNSVS